MDDKNKQNKKKPIRESRRTTSDKIGYVRIQDAYPIGDYSQNRSVPKSHPGKAFDKKSVKDDPYDEGGGFVLKER